MTKIRILDDHTINRIAAGEVIQRPASVVKELIENSIDAGATRIDVTVKNGGKTFIRIDDNGCGMDEEDLLLATERHGTSKVPENAEIFGATTLGFRGEALPSIAAVSSIEVESCDNLDTGGHRLTAVGGQIRDISPCPRAIGTSVEVKRLFYNTPARRKFLKSDTIEANHIREAVSGALLTHPEIAFTYRSDSRIIFRTPGSCDVIAAIGRVFGGSDSAQMVTVDKVSHDTLPFSVYGAVSNGLASRSASNCIVTSVNGRVFRSFQVNKIIQQVFSPYIAPKRWPMAVLFIEADPRIVDVNVHPSKLEVRFNFFEKLGRFISQTIKDTVNKSVPEMKFDDIPFRASGDDALAAQKKLFHGFASRPPSEPSLVRDTEYLFATSSIPSRALGTTPSASMTFARHSRPSQTYMHNESDNTGSERESIEDSFASQVSPIDLDRETRSLTILGQVFLSYIVAIRNDTLLLCDQHAAHERILYEKTLNRAQAEADNIQMLLCPAKISLSPDYVSILKDHDDDIARTGLIIEIDDDATVIVKGVPSLFSGQNLATIVQDMIDSYTSISVDTVEDEQKLRNSASIACKAAIKANQSLTVSEMEQLITELFTCKHPARCPHGRPTIIEVTKEQLEKSFLRRQ